MDALAEKFFCFVNTPWVPFLLFIHSFLESSVLPGGHDLFLIAVDVAKPSMCFVFAAISSIGSTCGGCFGYGLGRYGGRPLIERVVGAKIVDKIELYFQQYGIWAVAIAGFTPLPYKIFAIAAGIFEVNFIKFAIVSLITRAMRFFLVSGILYVIGPHIKEYLLNYFNVFTIGCILIGIMSAIALKIFHKKVSA